MAALIYILCALTSLACAWLVLRSYVRYRHRLMFWAGLCFCGLFISNALLVVDQLVVPEEDLSTLRLLAALVALLPLLYGLIWEEE
jgi:hypothetical protein